MFPNLSRPARRRSFLTSAAAALALLGLAPVLGSPAAAATPANVATTFVNDNIGKGMAILNNNSLSAAEKREQFQNLLLKLVDVRRIAVFTLGPYRRSAKPADIDAFVAAFRNYALAAYQTYFAKYSGQTIKIIDSTERTPTDFIVTTEMVSPTDNGKPPLEVDFRVRTDTGKPVLVDVAVAGIWLSLEQRDQFTAFLGQNNGDIHKLIAHLDSLAKNLNKS